MKKYFITYALVLLSIGIVSSQITVTQADMPHPGDTIRLSNTTDTFALPQLSLTGTNYTWDFRNLVVMSQTIDTFLNVSSTPFAYQLYFNDVFLYPAYVATVAQSVPNPVAIPPVSITNQINYYKTASSSYENVGFGAGINAVPTSVKEDTIDFIYRFPMNFGNSDSSNSSYHITIPGIGYYGTRQHRVNQVDGWGTLKTPFGTFQVLRMTTRLFVTDTLYVSAFSFGTNLPLPEQLQYKFLALGKGVPVLQINKTVVAGFPVFNNMVYRDSARKIIAGLTEVNSQLTSVKIYPNPVKSSFQIVSQVVLPDAEMEIYNVMGQKIMQKQLGKLISGNPIEVDMSSVAAGTYYLKLSYAGNEVTYKLVKD